MESERNDFQRECFDLLHRTVSDLGETFEFKVIESATFDQGPENFVHGRLARTGLEFWIYEDAAMYTVGEHKRHFEAPDFKSPSRLMEAFIGRVAELLSEHQATP
jgi:hypothetical protein